MAHGTGQSSGCTRLRFLLMLSMARSVIIVCRGVLVRATNSVREDAGAFECVRVGAATAGGIKATAGGKPVETIVVLGDMA
jgi:hypothetical protein